MFDHRSYAQSLSSCIYLYSSLSKGILYVSANVQMCLFNCHLNFEGETSTITEFIFHLETTRSRFIFKIYFLCLEFFRIFDHIRLLLSYNIFTP